MNNFNLLVSTSRFNEKNATAELWFTLLMCGDAYPIISRTQFPGLITSLTNLKPKTMISKIKECLQKNPHFFSFILKIVPIDFTCETDTKTINYIIQQHYQDFIYKEDSFKIILKRRHHEKIERNNFIEFLAKDIDNRVNLENPDKVIRIEVLGNNSGVSFLKKNDIIKIGN